ncbi:MAG: hypothetical protein CL484_01165 [Acidobacteria bacterium]|nr:hypothetical protein [Acidobacteriota bacterium]|tara:strand:+ start:1031 stop:1522 length:492 start_codon:yes stop_codon:yes gene_type:complete
MGAILTSATIWLALSLYAASQLWRRYSPARRTSIGVWLLGLGLTSYAAHIATAFEVHYNWSQAVAYAETARQAKAVFGWAFGGGLYINFLFGLFWLSEVCWWSKIPQGYLKRAVWLEWTSRSFFLLMVVNGAVIFVNTPQRWFGIVLVLIIVATWWPTRNLLS